MEGEMRWIITEYFELSSVLWPRDRPLLSAAAGINKIDQDYHLNQNPHKARPIV